MNAEITAGQCKVLFEDANSFFDVRHVDLKSEDHELPWATQIRRPGETTWTTVQRVSAKYSLMPHQDLVERLNEYVTQGFGAGGTIRIGFENKVHTQAAMVAIVDHPSFPQVNVATRFGEEDLVQFQLVAFNSYDKSRALKVAVGAVRFVCTNGMYFPAHLFGELKFIHYRQHDWTNVHAQLKEMLEHAAPRCKELWLAMKGHALTDDDREEFRAAFCDQEFIPLNCAIDADFDDRDDEASLWDLYNACTQYATHRVTGEAAKLIHERIAEHFYPQEQDQAAEKRDPTFVNSPSPSTSPPSSPSTSPSTTDTDASTTDDDEVGEEQEEEIGTPSEDESEDPPPPPPPKRSKKSTAMQTTELALKPQVKELIAAAAAAAVKPVNDALLQLQAQYDSLKEQCEKDHATIAKLIWLASEDEEDA